MTGRREFLTGLFSAGLVPKMSWADVGSPSFVAAARLQNGTLALIGLGQGGDILFQQPLPDRGHAAAAHPTRAEVVGFARRPGDFALVMDCHSGDLLHELTTPEGLHFFGHGTFSADGSLLFTSENDYENGEGMIGVWDAADGYRRIDQFLTFGVGPHELRLLPGRDLLVVANGGIETHPGMGRTKLNLPVMEPNLTYIGFDGKVAHQIRPPEEWHKLSMRHLAVKPDGRVALACQWQGEAAVSPPLLITHALDGEAQYHAGPAGFETELQGYAGSVSWSGDGRQIAITGPRGGQAGIFDADGQFVDRIEAADICGVAPGVRGFVFTTGTGRVLEYEAGHLSELASHDLNWDNHLVAIGEI